MAKEHKLKLWSTTGKGALSKLQADEAVKMLGRKGSRKQAKANAERNGNTFVGKMN
jgi:hypothetical protein